MERLDIVMDNLYTGFMWLEILLLFGISLDVDRYFSRRKEAVLKSGNLKDIELWRNIENNPTSSALFYTGFAIIAIVPAFIITSIKILVKD